MLHAPDLYDPIDHPSDNWYRRNYAIDQMVRYGYLEKGAGDRLKKHKCCGTIPDQQDFLVAPGQSEYFVSYVRRLLFDQYGEAAVYSGGMRVTTTLDLNLQRAAEHAIADALPDAENDPAAALVSIDPRTGEILAMVGGRDWSTNKVNYATGAGGSGRQSGSAFKAFTLAAAMQQGYDLHAYWNGPSTIGIPQCPDADQPDGIWHPVNAGDGEAGTFTLAGATAHSVNTVFAQLIAQLGPRPVVDMAHALGIRSDLPEVCSVTLGSVAVNPLEMTNAYATIADQGERHWATPLPPGEDRGRRGSTTASRRRAEQVLARNDANLVTYALQGVVSEGTGTAAALSGFPGGRQDRDGERERRRVVLRVHGAAGHLRRHGLAARGDPLENVEGVPSVYGGTIPASATARRSFA